VPLLIKLTGGFYQIVQADPDETMPPVLKFYDAFGNFYIGIRAPVGIDDEKTYILPYKPDVLLGLKQHIVVDDQNQLELISPDPHVEPASEAHTLPGTYDQTSTEAALDDLGSKINEVISALKATHIMEPDDVRMIPEPATMILKTQGPTTLVPAPATMVLKSEYFPDIFPGAASFVAKSIDPTVIIT
jgi:hypothetical protein